jgi:hypothetical protein
LQPQGSRRSASAAKELKAAQSTISQSLSQNLVFREKWILRKISSNEQNSAKLSLFVFFLFNFDIESVPMHFLGLYF